MIIGSVDLWTTQTLVHVHIAVYHLYRSATRMVHASFEHGFLSRSPLALCSKDNPMHLQYADGAIGFLQEDPCHYLSGLNINYQKTTLSSVG